MPFKAKVKWNKQVFESVSLDPSKGAQALKQTLYELTGVPVDRQKVMAKELWKGTLKDDQDINSPNWKDGVLIAMMGTSTGIPKPPEEKTVFLEDMSTTEKQKVGSTDPPGLVNLGNTCYMNSVLQCLRAIPDLRDCLEEADTSDLGGRVVSALRNLYKEMDSSDSYVTPREFVSIIRSVFPRFAERTAQGGFAQQDADEFFNEVMGLLSSKLTKPPTGMSLGHTSNCVDALFGVDLSTEMQCLESDEEPRTTGQDAQRRMQCTITADVVTLEQGLKLGLEAEIEKRSETLGRNALFRQTRRIKRLPQFLTIQLNRFFWKRTPGSRDHQGVNCKILKPVKFPHKLDVFDLCDDELKQILKVPRDKHMREKMEKTGLEEEGGAEDVDMEDEELQAALKLSMTDGKTAGIGIPPEFRGIYELYAVTTHKGRASDSGHYMAWVKQSGNNWVVFDDETASPVKEEDINQLHGGGDFDMAFILFYRMYE